MWIRIETVSSGQDAIFLPGPLASKLDSHVVLHFGKKTAAAKIVKENSLESMGGDSFKNPMKIGVSIGLRFILQIPAPLVYQMKFNKSHIVIGPVIGLLLGNQNHMYSPIHMEKYSDRCKIYDKIGGLIYAFSPRAIDWKNSLAYGLYYSCESGEWQYGKFPLPAVIYRRDFHTNPGDIEKLIKITKGKLFNSWRFTKYYLYQYIGKDKELSAHLPPTELSRSYEQVKKFIDTHNNVILKPISLSRGRGICVIRKDEEIYKIDDYRPREVMKIAIKDDSTLERFFKANSGFFKNYLIQKHLSLAKIDGASFDIRVVMQRTTREKWGCSGIECRVAGSKNLITNISRGGYALTIHEAIEGAFPGDPGNEQLKEQVNNLCHKLCKYLDGMGHHFAEFGMDIAVDEERNLWIIEVNVFPSFKGFKDMDYDTYLKIRFTPIFYAAYLAGFYDYNKYRGENNE